MATSSWLVSLLVTLCLVPWPRTVVGTSAAKMSSTSAKSTYIVHMDRNASHTDISIKAAWYTELLRRAKRSSIGEELEFGDLHHVYHHAFNGFSALLTAEQVEFLQAWREVLQLQPDRLRHVSQTTYTPEYLGLAAGVRTCGQKANNGDDVIFGVIGRTHTESHVMLD